MRWRRCRAPRPSRLARRCRPARAAGLHRGSRRLFLRRLPALRRHCRPLAIMRAIVEAAGKACRCSACGNGFQILTEAGLLPGALLRNAGIRFICRDAPLSSRTRSRCSLRATPRASGFPSRRPPRRQLLRRRGHARQAGRRRPGRTALCRRHHGSARGIAGVLIIPATCSA